ncbi:MULTISPECIES: hypothetical protein [Streptomyces]|uniref:hypothetical protein n=1 Tax=Streptomyces TaxID=1883 RepID=UPI0022499D6A|nr:hypothetical protein [Streptomyces sp. JHD 1]MCX2967891.1 hypothetical protein [Streptomyces sp. JHD 1]
MDVPVVRASADLRLLRAAVFTAACVALSAAGHVFAAGAGVPLWAFGAAAALVFVLVLPLAGRERSPLGIVAALAVGQAGLHVLFASAQSRAAAAPARSGAPAEDGGAVLALARGLLCAGGSAEHISPARARRVVADAGLGGSATAVDPGAGPGAAGHAAHAAPDGLGAVLELASPAMLLGHLLAAVLAGWLLRCGDAALWRLVRPAVTAVDGLLRALRSALACLGPLAGGRAACGPRATVRPVDEDGPPEPRSLRHSVVRRGPPASACALAA